jgi:hypothetical protein
LGAQDCSFYTGSFLRKHCDSYGRRGCYWYNVGIRTGRYWDLGQCWIVWNRDRRESRWYLYYGGAPEWVVADWYRCIRCRYSLSLMTRTKWKMWTSIVVRPNRCWECRYTGIRKAQPFLRQCRCLEGSPRWTHQRRLPMGIDW